jgi:hypothetical protein
MHAHWLGNINVLEQINSRTFLHGFTDAKESAKKHLD